MDLICIDLEASGLGAESYPIEVAWKNDTTGEQDNFLINPDSADGWHYWDDYAEEMHGLDRNELCNKGLDIKEACERLNIKLAGKTLVSDAYQFDLFWMKRLFAATGIEPSFRLAGLDRFLNKEQLIQFGFLAKAQFRRHRAMNDVEDILSCMRAVMFEAS